MDHGHRIKNVFDDLPPDLDRLHTLRVWHTMWLQRIDAKIAALARVISIRVADELGAAELVHQVDEGLRGPRTQVVNLERSGPRLPVIDRGSGRLMTLVDVSRSGCT